MHCSIKEAFIANAAMMLMGRFHDTPIDVKPTRRGRHYKGPAPRGYRWAGVRYSPNGEREKARRVRQIAAGQLRYLERENV